VCDCIVIDAGQLANGLPYVSAVLKTSVAIEASIHIARAFTQLRQLLGSHKELMHKLEALEKQYDAKFQNVFDAIRRLMRRTKVPRRSGLVVKGFT
jgi:hypothetical protein